MKNSHIAKKLLKIIFLLITFFVIRVCLDNGTYAAYEYQEGQRYELRLGNMYFKTFDEFINNQWIVQQNPNLEKPYRVELLQPEITISNTYSNFYFAQNSGAIFTTASSEGEYPYQGEPGTKAVFKRGPYFTGTFFTFSNGQYGFENVDFDGGWNDDKSGMEANAAMVTLSGSATVSFIDVELRNNCNSNTTKGGGAIYSDNGIVVMENSTITNCCACDGGGLAVGNTTVEMTNVTITECYSTSATLKNASAFSSNATSNAYSLTLTNVDINNCVALNATEYGAAVETINFGIWNLDNVNITNNYSPAGNAGFVQSKGNQSNFSPINIDGDIVIDDNYGGCVIDGYTVTSQGTESNLWLEQPNTVNINTNITEATSVGVGVEGKSIKDGIVTFANADNSTTGLENFFSDEDNTVRGQSSGENTGIFGAVAQETQKETLIIQHIDKGVYTDTTQKHKYQIKYILDGNEVIEEIERSHQNSYTVELDRGTEFEVKLNQETNEAFDIVTSMPEGNTVIPDVNKADVVVTGSIDVEGEGKITFIRTKELSPATGIDGNLDEIIIFAVLIGLLYLVNKKLKLEK